MSLFLSLVTVLLRAAATAGNLHSDGASTTASVSQIRSTLQNLLRSIEDNGRDSEALSSKRQLWCDSAIHDFDASNHAETAKFLEMQAQLTETQAAVEEAKGTVQQVHVDMEMVQHTIKQTESLLQQGVDADAGKLRSLANNKRLSLTSLKGELKVAEPVLAQLQASAAELKERISYRSDSLSVAKDFIAALHEGCQKSADRSDRQAAARLGESNSIHVALQTLEQLTASKAPSSDKDDESDSLADQAASALSFVQLADRDQDEVTLDDLSDLFSASQPSGVAALTKGIAHEQQRVAKVTAAAPSVRPRIQTLLTEIKDAGSNNDQVEFCSTQRESSKMAMKFAQDSVNQISSEVVAHTEVEAELSDELQKLQTLAAAVTESAKASTEQATKEQTLLQSSRKDQELATKILDQAVTILKELKLPNAAKVESGLVSAKKMLATQVQSAAGFQSEAVATAKAISDQAAAFTQTQESEQHNLEFTRDDHAAQRLKAVENKRLYEADAEEATVYVQKLEESCKDDVLSQAAQQRSAQVHALQDADSALAGKLEVNSLRGADASHSKPTAAPQNLTPMQRAALEMGVSTD